MLQLLGITDVKDKEWTSFFLIALGIIVLGATILYEFFFLNNSQVHLAYLAIGLSGVWLAIILRISSSIVLGKYFSLHAEVADDHEIIKEGVYRYIRHPMYTANLALGFFAALTFGSMLGIICFFIIYAPIFFYRIRIEEEILSNKFKEEYIKYKAETYSLLPYVW